MTYYFYQRTTVLKKFKLTKKFMNMNEMENISRRERLQKEFVVCLTKATVEGHHHGSTDVTHF
jgi:hypothetical protein